MPANRWTPDVSRHIITTTAKLMTTNNQAIPFIANRRARIMTDPYGEFEDSDEMEVRCRERDGKGAVNYELSFSILDSHQSNWGFRIDRIPFVADWLPRVTLVAIATSLVMLLN